MFVFQQAPYPHMMGDRPPVQATRQIRQEHLYAPTFEKAYGKLGAALRVQESIYGLFDYVSGITRAEREKGEKSKAGKKPAAPQKESSPKKKGAPRPEQKKKAGDESKGKPKAGVRRPGKAEAEVPTMVVLDACYLINLFTRNVSVREILKAMKGSGQRDIMIPEQVFRELESQSADRRAHGKNKLGVPDNALLVPPKKLQELRKAIYSDGSAEIVPVEVDNATMGMLSAKLKNSPDGKMNSRVGSGEAGIYILISQFGPLYDRVIVLSTDSDVPAILEGTPQVK